MLPRSAPDGGRGRGGRGGWGRGGDRGVAGRGGDRGGAGRGGDRGGGRGGFRGDGRGRGDWGRGRGRGDRGGPRGGGGRSRGRGAPVGSTTPPPLPAAHVEALGVKRPGYGNRGHWIALESNHVEVKLNKGIIHHYDGMCLSFSFKDA